MMAGAQLGITICTLGLGALTEPALAHVLEPLFVWAGVPEELLHPVAVVPSLLVVTALHVVIGEMVPKNLTLAAPDQAALALAPILNGFVRLAGPVVTGLNAIAAGLLRLVRVEPQHEVADAVTQEQVGLLLAESRREGLIDPDIHHRTSHVLAFTERPVTDALVPDRPTRHHHADTHRRRRRSTRRPNRPLPIPAPGREPETSPDTSTSRTPSASRHRCAADPYQAPRSDPCPS